MWRKVKRRALAKVEEVGTTITLQSQVERLTEKRKKDFIKYVSIFRGTTSPCFACGSKHHSLVGKPDSSNNHTWVYTCPVINPREWDVSQEVEHWAFSYDISPSKFAAEYHYDEHQVQQAWRVYLRCGIGLEEEKVDLKRTRREILRICDEVRSSWEFKRTNSLDWVLDCDWDDHEGGVEL